jgi:hypothetical protein
LIAGGCAHGKDANPYADWVVVRAYSFTVYTDTSPGTYQEVVRDLEALHAALVTGIFPRTELRGVEVLLFSTPEAQRDAIASAQVPFVRPDVRPMVLTARNPRGRSARDVSRYTSLPEQQAATDLLRRMLKLNMRRAPTWFRLGLEQYVETVSIEGDVARFGHRLPRPTQELAAGRAIPLGQLIAAPDREFNAGSWQRSHRASAWAFIHYLMGGERGALRPRFDALATALVEADDRRPATSRAAIVKAFPDVDFATLEARARDYAVVQLGQRNFFHPFTIRFPAPPERHYPAEPGDRQRIEGILAGLK